MSNSLAETKSGLVIRYATHEDIPQIAHIARVTWDNTYSDTIDIENRQQFLQRAYKTENLVEAIDVPGHWFYIAEDAAQNQLVGFAHFLKRYHPTQARSELVRLYILPEHQNLGRGKALLKKGFQDLAQDGIEQCFVSVQESNVLARKFYERHGFTYRRNHGQFLGTQIVTLVEYIRPITSTDV